MAVQVFFPYLIIYLQTYLKLDAYALVLGVVLLAASAISVLSGRFVDRLGKLRCVPWAVAVMCVGLVLMYFARSMGFVIAAGIVMMAGYMLVTAVLSALVRDHTPADRVGSFQGIRMIFGVLVPMIAGRSLARRSSAAARAPTRSWAWSRTCRRRRSFWPRRPCC